MANPFSRLCNIGRVNFNSKTIIRHAPELPPRIPMDRFFLVDYNHLDPASTMAKFFQEKSGKEILKEILGRIKTIKPAEETPVKGDRIESKCEIYLQNLTKLHLPALNPIHFTTFDLNFLNSDIQTKCRGRRVYEYVTLWGEDACSLDI